jgi:hypothetical protein
MLNFQYAMKTKAVRAGLAVRMDRPTRLKTTRHIGAKITRRGCHQLNLSKKQFGRCLTRHPICLHWKTL